MPERAVTSLERLRETVAVRVQATSLRTVAREVGMSPAGLEKFLAGETPYSASRQRLQEWWVREGSRPRSDLTVEGVEMAIGALVRDLPPEHRVEAIGRVVDALRRLYAAEGATEPPWLAQLAEVWPAAGAPGTLRTPAPLLGGGAWWGSATTDAGRAGMPTRNASAAWEGGLKGGNGRFDGESGAIGGTYSFGSRFGDQGGTNPEELLAAAEAACFSMALSAGLEQAGHAPTRVETKAACTVDKVADGFAITTMRLKVRATVPGIDDAAFQEIARATKSGCPVSKALAGVDIQLEATLES